MNIKLTPKQVTLSSIAGGVILASGVLAVFGVDVPGILPVTRSAHAQAAEEHAEQHATEQSALVRLLEDIKRQSEDFERRWECDEISEDMLELRQEMARLGDRDNTLAEAYLAAEQAHMQKAARWSELNCVEFVE